MVCARLYWEDRDFLKHLLVLLVVCTSVCVCVCGGYIFNFCLAVPLSREGSCFMRSLALPLSRSRSLSRFISLAVQSEPYRAHPVDRSVRERSDGFFSPAAPLTDC